MAEDTKAKEVDLAAQLAAFESEIAQLSALAGVTTPSAPTAASAAPAGNAAPAALKRVAADGGGLPQAKKMRKEVGAAGRGAMVVASSVPQPRVVAAAPPSAPVRQVAAMAPPSAPSVGVLARRPGLPTGSVVGQAVGGGGMAGVGMGGPAPGSVMRGPEVAVPATAVANNPTDKRKGKFVRMAAGKKWVDKSLGEWPDNDFRLFVGDIGPDVTEIMLERIFGQYTSFAKAKVIKRGRGKAAKCYGFASFLDHHDASTAIRDWNGKYIGSRPCKLSRSRWEEREVKNAKKRAKNAMLR